MRGCRRRPRGQERPGHSQLAVSPPQRLQAAPQAAPRTGAIVSAQRAARRRRRQPAAACTRHRRRAQPRAPPGTYAGRRVWPRAPQGRAKRRHLTAAVRWAGHTSARYGAHQEAGFHAAAFLLDGALGGRRAAAAAAAACIKTCCRSAARPLRRLMVGSEPRGDRGEGAERGGAGARRGGGGRRATTRTERLARRPPGRPGHGFSPLPEPLGPLNALEPASRLAASAQRSARPRGSPPSFRRSARRLAHPPSTQAPPPTAPRAPRRSPSRGPRTDTPLNTAVSPRPFYSRPPSNLEGKFHPKGNPRRSDGVSKTALVTR